MKTRILLILLVVIPTFMAGGAAGVWFTYVNLHHQFQKGSLMLKDVFFIEQVNSIKSLQEGTPDKAFEYLRAMNEYAILQLYAESSEELNIELLNKETIEFACSDLKQHPYSWFTGADESLENIKPACEHLLRFFDEHQ